MKKITVVVPDDQVNKIVAAIAATIEEGAEVSVSSFCEDPPSLWEGGCLLRHKTEELATGADYFTD